MRLLVSRLGPDLNESVWGRARDGNKNDSVHRTLPVSIFPWRGTRIKDKHVKIELFLDKITDFLCIQKLVILAYS